MSAPGAAAQVKRHADGTFFVRPYMGTNPVTGARERPYHRLAATDRSAAEAEAAEWLAGYLGERRVSDALADYVEARRLAGAAANTVLSYRAIARNYVVPAIGRARVRDVTARSLVDLYGRLVEGGGEGGAPLSRGTALDVHWFLRGAFDWFVRMGYRADNPALAADKPRSREGEAAPLDDEGLESLRAALASVLDSDASAPRERAVAMAAWLSLHTGMRCGEVCALRRCDVRRASGDVRVCGTVVEPGGPPVRQDRTKTGHGRTVSLDVETMRRLSEHMRRCPGTRDGPAVTPDGSLMRPSRLARDFSAMARSLGLPEGTRFHSLRHTHATWLLVSGVDVKTVAERLGHASPATTLRAYAHVLPGRDAEAARAFARAAGGE